MLRLLADENFNDRIVRGVLRRLPELDIIRAHDAGLSGAVDADLLEWAAEHDCVLVTHDLKTMPALISV